MSGTCEDYRRYKALGLCPRCKGRSTPEAGSFFCRACKDKSNAQKRARKRRLEREGLCNLCGNTKVEHPPRCAACRKKANAYLRKKRARYVREGRCMICSGDIEFHREGMVECQKCSNRGIAYKARRRGMERAYEQAQQA